MFKTKSTLSQKIQNLFGSSRSHDTENLAKKLKILKNALLVLCMSIYLLEKLKKKKKCQG